MSIVSSFSKYDSHDVNDRIGKSIRSFVQRIFQWSKSSCFKSLLLLLLLMHPINVNNNHIQAHLIPLYQATVTADGNIRHSAERHSSNENTSKHGESIHLCYKIQHCELETLSGDSLNLPDHMYSIYTIKWETGGLDDGVAAVLQPHSSKVRNT
ncbi:hypothetical protein Tco_0522450 [Tanacetum coccineum]